MNNKNNTKKKVIAVILVILALAIALLFLLKGCQKEEPVHTHSYKINEEGTWICKDDNDILSNTDKPYVAILENNQPKDILAIDSLSKTKINLGNGTIYKDGNNIYYSGNNAQTVIIKTQKVDDKQKDKDNLVINAPNDSVYHYGSSTVISLDAVATNSFHEYGKVELITLTKARVVLENPSDVKEIYLDINDSNYSYETTIIALKENVELPRLTRDAVDLEEGEVKTLAIVQKLKDEVKTETNTETNEVIETVLEVQAADDDYVKIENVRKSNDELIIEAFLSPNADENDKTLTDNQSTSTITLEEAKEGSSHPASHNTFVPKQEKVIEVIKPTETKEETKQEETKPVVTPTKKEETKPEVTPTDDDKPSPKPHTHSYGDWYEVEGDDVYHYKKCSCGYTIKEAHTYGDWDIVDGDNEHHYKECSCGKKQKENHTPNGDSPIKIDGNNNQHKIKCAVCDKYYLEDHTRDQGRYCECDHYVPELSRIWWWGSDNNPYPKKVLNSNDYYPDYTEPKAKLQVGQMLPIQLSYQTEEQLGTGESTGWVGITSSNPSVVKVTSNILVPIEECQYMRWYSYIYCVGEGTCTLTFEDEYQTGLVKYDVEVTVTRETTIDKIDIGSYYTFGSFDFKDASGDSLGTHDIEWVVLDKDVANNRIYVVSKDILCDMKFDNSANKTATFDSSSIKTWLNGDFKNGFGDNASKIYGNIELLNHNGIPHKGDIAGTYLGDWNANLAQHYGVTLTKGGIGSGSTNSANSPKWWVIADDGKATLASMGKCQHEDFITPYDITNDALFGVRPAMWITLGD